MKAKTYTYRIVRDFMVIRVERATNEDLRLIKASVEARVALYSRLDPHHAFSFTCEEV